MTHDLESVLVAALNAAGVPSEQALAAATQAAAVLVSADTWHHPSGGTWVRLRGPGVVPFDRRDTAALDAALRYVLAHSGEALAGFAAVVYPSRLAGAGLRRLVWRTADGEVTDPAIILASLETAGLLYEAMVYRLDEWRCVQDAGHGRTGTAAISTAECGLPQAQSAEAERTGPHG